VEWVLEGLANGDEAVLSFRVQLPEQLRDPVTGEALPRLDVENTARLLDEDNEGVYPPEGYDRPSNGTHHYVRGPMLEVIKQGNRAQGSLVKDGDSLSYAIVVSNTGEEWAYDVLVRDRLPAGLEFIVGSERSSREDVVFIREGNVLGWIIPELGPGESVELRFRVHVGEMEQVGARELFNVAEVSENVPGTDPEEGLRTGENFGRSNTVEYHQLRGGQITVRKVDAETGERLAGAEFVLRQVWAPSPAEEMEDRVAYSDANGEAIFLNVPVGRYIVIETVPPAGYIGSEIRRSVHITAERPIRSITVPNYRIVEIDPDANGNGGFMEIIMDLGIPNAGAMSRNVGDIPK